MQLDILRKQFVQNSLERLIAMESLLDALEREPSDRNMLRELLIHFHRFAGLGSTYGHPAATRHGQTAETRAAALLRENAVPSREDFRAWRDLLAALRDDLAAD